MLSTEHLPATVGAFLAGDDTVVHIADLIAFGRAGLADLRTKFVKTGQKMRAGQLKISRSLTDFGTVHHQSQMFGFDMFTPRFQTVVHGGL